MGVKGEKGEYKQESKIQEEGVLKQSIQGVYDETKQNTERARGIKGGQSAHKDN